MLLALIPSSNTHPHAGSGTKKESSGTMPCHGSRAVLEFLHARSHSHSGSEPRGRGPTGHAMLCYSPRLLILPPPTRSPLLPLHAMHR